MRGLKTNRTATVIIAGHAFIQNLRRSHYELGVDTRADRLRCAVAFDELSIEGSATKRSLARMRRNPWISKAATDSWKLRRNGSWPADYEARRSAHGARAMVGAGRRVEGALASTAYSGR